MIAPQTHFLHDKSYLSTAASHFFVDVLNNGRVLLVALILPAYFYIPAGDMARFPLLLLTGLFGDMPHAILVLMIQSIQSLLPGRRALGAGLALGFMFLSRAAGSAVMGFIADRPGHSASGYRLFAPGRGRRDPVPTAALGWNDAVATGAGQAPPGVGRLNDLRESWKSTYNSHTHFQ